MPTQKRPAAKMPAPAKTPAGVKAAVPAKTAAKSTPKTVPQAAPPVAPPSKTVAKPAPPAGAAQAKVAKPVKPAKPAKPPKLRTKPVRDSFTMPEADFALVATLKARALSAQCVAKKSELLRAGLHALAALDTPALVAALGQLDPVKIGRPKKGH